MTIQFQGVHKLKWIRGSRDCLSLPHLLYLLGICSLSESGSRGVQWGETSLGLNQNPISVAMPTSPIGFLRDGNEDMVLISSLFQVTGYQLDLLHLPNTLLSFPFCPTIVQSDTSFSSLYHKTVLKCSGQHYLKVLRGWPRCWRKIMNLYMSQP